MLETVENAFRGLVSALQIAKLYGLEHPKFTKFLDASYDEFQRAFQEHPELVFGIIGEELAFEKEILFDLSRTAKPIIMYLKVRAIERLAFQRSMQKEELRKFISFLMMAKEELKKEPQEYLAAVGIHSIAVGKIQKAAEKSEAVASADHLNLYMNSLETFNRSLEDILDTKDVDYLGLRFNVTNIFESLLGRYHELLKLTVVKRYDLSTFSHILNVAILSMFFASKLGLEKDDILDIGIAALFHDIGKMYVSRTIIKRTTKLSDEEFEKIKAHTLSGAAILLKYVDTLGVLPVLVAFEHHLKSDLKGYPKLQFPQKQHFASAIVAVCDVYDALFSRRSYKAGLPPNVVYDILMKEKTKFYYPELLDSFFRFMGVWPIGTIVALSDGRIAVVREENDSDIFAPKVAVIFPPEEKQTIDLATAKGTLTITKSLDPLSEEGKPYASLV